MSTQKDTDVRLSLFELMLAILCFVITIYFITYKDALNTYISGHDLLDYGFADFATQWVKFALFILSAGLISKPIGLLIASLIHIIKVQNHE